MNPFILKNFEEIIVYKFNDVKLYIDILHNKDNINPQQEVIDNLYSADAMLIIETEKTYCSVWVKEEIKMAKQKNIPIYIIEYRDIQDNINGEEKYIKIFNMIRSIKNDKIKKM